MHCLPSSMHLISAMRHSLRMLPFFASNFWSYDTNLSHNFCACIFVQDDSYFKISFVLINRVHMLLFLSIILISICVIIWTYCISLIVQHWSFSRNNFYHWWLFRGHYRTLSLTFMAAFTRRHEPHFYHASIHSGRKDCLSQRYYDA